VTSPDSDLTAGLRRRTLALPRGSRLSCESRDASGAAVAREAPEHAYRDDRA
jgi:hypothetical protein